MKKIFIRSVLALTAFVVLSSFAFPTAAKAPAPVATVAPLSGMPEMKGLNPELLKMSMNDFMSLTPAKYKKLTGEKMGIKKAIQLKAAQKMMKKRIAAGEDIPKGLYIVLAILGLGWLAIGLLTDFKGNDWWVNLLLTLLCWLPGVIHALVVMKKYYK